MVGTFNQSVPEMVIVHVFINIYELFTISTKWVQHFQQYILDDFYYYKKL